MPGIDQLARRLGEVIALRQIAHGEDHVTVSVIVKISGIFVDPEGRRRFRGACVRTPGRGMATKGSDGLPM